MYLHNKGHNYYRQQWWVGLYNTQMNNIPYLYCTTYLSEGVLYIYQRRKIKSGYLSGSAEMNLYVYVPQHIFQTADYHAALSVPLQETTLKWTCVKSRYIEQSHIYITLWNGTEVFPHCNVSYRNIIRVILYPRKAMWPVLQPRSIFCFSSVTCGRESLVLTGSGISPETLTLYLSGCVT